jgi:transposase
MGARLRVFLTPEQNWTLFELRTARTVPQRVKDRAEAVRMSHQGMYVEKIAVFFNWNVQTVRDTLHRWQQHGLGGLWDALAQVLNPGGSPKTLSTSKPAYEKTLARTTLSNWRPSLKANARSP